MNIKLLIIAGFFMVLVPIAVAIGYGSYLIGYTQIKDRFRAWLRRTKEDFVDLWKTMTE